MGTFFQKCSVIAKSKMLPAVCSTIQSNRFKTITVSALCVVLSCIFTGITVATNLVTIHDGNTTKIIYTMKNDAEEIIESQGILLSDKDKVKFSGFDENNTGTIDILRAFEVSVAADGEKKMVAVSEATVSDVLELAGVTLSEDDLINVGLNEKVHAGTEIEINRVTYRTVQKTDAIPFSVTKKNSLMVGKGNTKISIPGKEGVRLTTSREKLVDGEVVESEVLTETVEKNPVAQLLLVGMAPKNPISILTPPESLQLNAKGVPTSYKRKVSGKAVAYSALGKKTKLRPGNVAVDYRKFPKGSKLWICTPDNKYVYGYAVAADTGTFALDPNTEVLVDLFFGSYRESVKWGAKKVDIYVLK